MRKHALLALTVLAVFGLAACGSEDTTGVDDTADEIVGTWVSKGTDVAPGLVQLLSVDSIYATFNDDGTYLVLNYAGGSDQPGELTGTYVVGSQPEGEIRSITLTQNQPAALTSEGIFQVTGTTMEYEVIQTEPDVGALPPTVEGGFGSTVVQGTPTGVYWIQNYDLVEDM